MLTKNVFSFYSGPWPRELSPERETFPTANFQPRSNATPGIAAQARARTGAKDFLLSNSLPLDPRRALQGEIDFSSVQFSEMYYLKKEEPEKGAPLPPLPLPHNYIKSLNT